MWLSKRLDSHSKLCAPTEISPARVSFHHPALTPAQFNHHHIVNAYVDHLQYPSLLLPAMTEHVPRPSEPTNPVVFFDLALAGELIIPFPTLLLLR